MPVTPVAGAVDLPPPGYDLVPGSLMFAASTSSVPPPASVSSSLRSEYNPVSEGDESVNLKDVSGVSTPTGTPRQAHRGLEDDASSVGGGSVRSVGPSSVASSSRARSDIGDLDSKVSGLHLDVADRDGRETTPTAEDSTKSELSAEGGANEAAAVVTADDVATPGSSSLEAASPEEAGSSEETQAVTPRSEVTKELRPLSKEDESAPDKTDAKDENYTLPAALAESMSTEMLARPDESAEDEETKKAAVIAGAAAIAATTAGAIPVVISSDKDDASDKRVIGEEPSSAPKATLASETADGEQAKAGQGSTSEPEAKNDSFAGEETSSVGETKGDASDAVAATDAAEKPKNSDATKLPSASKEGLAPMTLDPVVDAAYPSDADPEAMEIATESDIQLVPSYETAHDEAAAKHDTSSRDDTSKGPVSEQNDTSSDSDRKVIGRGVPRSRGLTDLTDSDHDAAERDITPLASAFQVRDDSQRLDRDLTPHAAASSDHEGGMDMDRETTPVPDGFNNVDDSDDIQPPPALDDDSDIVSVMGGAMSERDMGSPLASNRSSMPAARASSELEFRFEDLHERFFRDTKPEPSSPLASGNSSLPSTTVVGGSSHSRSQSSSANQPGEESSRKVTGGTRNVSALPASALSGAAGLGLAAAAAKSDFREDPSTTEIQGLVPGGESKDVAAPQRQFPSVPQNELDGSPTRRPVHVHVEPSPHGIISDAPKTEAAGPSLRLSAPSPSQSPSPSASEPLRGQSPASFGKEGKPIPDFPNAPRTTLSSTVTSVESDPRTPQQVTFSPSETPAGGLTPMTPGILMSFPKVPDETHPYVGVKLSPTRSSLSGPTGPDHPSIPFPREGKRSPSPAEVPRRSSSLEAAGGLVGASRTPITPPTTHQPIVSSTPPFETTSPNLSVEGLDLDRAPGSRSPGRKRNSFSPRSPYLDDEDPGDFEPGEGWALVSKWEPWRGSPPR